MNVHVIISTYNGAEWIEKCINSVQQSSINIQINIVDNLSTDDTTAIIKSKYPEVYLIENTENMGFGKANNAGIRKALADQADYVFLLNQDAWVEADTIEGLIKVHQQHPEYGILSPVHLNGAGTALDFNFSRYCSFERCPGLFSDIYLNTMQEVYDIRFVNAALWLISRACLEEVGLFDPIFPVYVEDMDYVSRTKYKNYRIGLAPRFKGYHDRANRPANNAARDRLLRHLKYKFMLKDNSISFGKAFARFSALHAKRLIGYLVSLKGEDFIHELKTGASILSSLPAIRSSRKRCEKSGAYITA